MKDKLTGCEDATEWMWKLIGGGLTCLKMVIQ